MENGEHCQWRRVGVGALLDGRVERDGLIAGAAADRDHEALGS
jgi:hypothetical protein